MEQFEINGKTDTIAAISTPPGIGGIAVIRISGPKAIEITARTWEGNDILKAKGKTVHYGKYYTVSGELLDEPLLTVFRAPASFTGEDVVEISVHGSAWIQREILSDLIKRGVRIAEPGEFTMRAFTNGKIDLAQAEGVADLIASSSRAAHKIAVEQTRGGFSRKLENLRHGLIDFASLLELELDFSEEDVEFADRKKLRDLANDVVKKIEKLAASYSMGAAIKNGIPVVIAGVPNAGKSSLLNLLLDDEKAIVSEIPGTTRDVIEDTAEINGYLYRFIDTAGLREATDKIENIGIERARANIRKARIVIWILDVTSPLSDQIKELKESLAENIEKPTIILLNKTDIDDLGKEKMFELQEEIDRIKPHKCQILKFSAISGEGKDELLAHLDSIVRNDTTTEADNIITNARHYEALLKSLSPLQRAIEGLDTGLSGDFIAQDIREALHHLGTITGAITTDNLLNTIFSRFCIGK